MECLPISCVFCKAPYCEQRVPRNLTCGHVLCTSCMDSRLTSGKFCPTCHEKQPVNQASDLTVNYPLLRAIESYNDGDVKIEGVAVPLFPPCVPSPDMEDAGECLAHGGPMVFLCISCSMWVCEDCLVVDHPNLPRGSCLVLGIVEALAQVEKEYHERAEDFLTNIESLRGNSEHEAERHDICLKYCHLDLSPHKNLVQVITKDLEEIKKKDELKAEQFMEKVKRISDVVSKTSSAKVITSSCKELAECQDDLKAYMALEMERKTPVHQNILKHFRMDLNLLVEEHKQPMYAVQEEGGKTRWALITHNKKGLLLFSLQNGDPPNDGIVFPYGFVRELVNKETPTLFFEVEWAGRIEGYVLVLLFGDTFIGREAVLRCSGEREPSYRNTIFTLYEPETSVLWLGYDERREVTRELGIRPFGDILWHDEKFNESDYYKPSIEAGMTEIEVNYCRKFLFHLQSRNECAYSSLGMVTEGLDILRSASEVKPLADSGVRDSGLFIPL